MSTFKFNKKYKRINLLLDILSFIALISLFLITFASWTRLPDIIPTHYDLSGHIDSYGSKNTIIAMPIISLFSFFLLFILAKYPECYNYPVKITPMNKEIQYAIGSTFMRIINLEIVLLFLIIQIEIINFSPNIFTAMLVMLVITISCIIYFMKASKHK